MSGAEAAIAGVGFLCNAMQIVTFGRDLLQVCRQIRASKSPDPNLEEYLKSAEGCFNQRKAYFNQMRASASAATRAQALSTNQQQIIEVGKKLDDSVDELQSKFAKLHLDNASRGGIRGTARMGKKAIASMWQSQELKALEENLKRYESLLNGVMIHHVCDQLQAAEIKSTQYFYQLNTGVQSFITKLADGCTKMSELSHTSLETRDRITQEHETTRAAMDQGFTSTQIAVSSIRDLMSQRLQDSAQRELSKDLERRHERLLESLGFSEMNGRKSQVSKNYPGTFSWVFEDSFYCNQGCSLSRGQTHDERGDDDTSVDDAAPTIASPIPNSFPAWLESDLNLFWISGKPASGKSSLMKFLATNSLTRQHLEVWQSNTEVPNRKLQILTHFFWKPGKLLQRNIKGMMLSLLHQVLYGDPCLAQRLWEDQENVLGKRSHDDWDLNELGEALCYAIKSSRKAFCIFLDGLDEAKGSESLSWRDKGDAQIIPDLLDLSNVKLCASSREEDPFCLYFKGQLRLRIHLLTYKDICDVAENRLEVSGLDSSHRALILKAVAEKSKGVFLWVILVLDSLNRGIRSGTASIDELLERLARSPADLNDLLADMWKRAGDDAELSGYRTDASRYFNIVITANKLQEYTDDSEDKGTLMNSLPVIATAVENESPAQIVDKGRSIPVDELEKRCAKVENRLRLVSRGLLEITTTTDKLTPRSLEGKSRRFQYDNKRIEFIHRSAFDFITDTPFGRECLNACDWCPCEQVHRLLAGHLVRCRFVDPGKDGYNASREGTMIYSMVKFDSLQLQMALMIADLQSSCNFYLETSMIRIIKDWQESGLFSAHAHWEYPQGSKVPSNPYEVEFLENVLKTVGKFPIVAGLLDQLSIGRFIDAIPALLRGASQSYADEMDARRCLELIKYLLTRLTNGISEGCPGISSQAQADLKNATLLLHSWFIIQCLFIASSSITSEWQEMLDLLDQFRDTLSSTKDWQYPLVLRFGRNLWSQLSFVDIYTCMGMGNQTIVAITNFVTAYRIIGRLLQDRLHCPLYTQSPQDSSERFEVVLIGGGNINPDSDNMLSPAKEYHEQIAAHLEDTLLGMRSRTNRKEEEAWGLFIQSISNGLTSVGDDGMGFCMRELAKRGLEFGHPWLSNWVITEEKEDSIEDHTG